MDCPARSPDLNLIQHTWDDLRRTIATRNLPPRCINSPLNEWNPLPQGLINSLISNIKPRSTRKLLATDHVILNYGQMMWMIPELAPPLSKLPHQREVVSALDKFNVHRCPTRCVFSGTVLKLTHDIPAMIRYLDHWATAASFQ
ncbi:uncharacterized protein TNCV_4284261 [Trichonephila clavipes]|uniref:Uncharacterized protein n=1 Tax=Trichonephila clavipes TaxID=2585209 RepID=A0A8X6STN5_TRICX|nr:uncharacterized protein TNCV_4284261 [Trichonephila clavipes]